MNVNRTYRNRMHNDDLVSFTVAVRETDLFISIGSDNWSPEIPKEVEKLVHSLRFDLEKYIEFDPEFKTALNPHPLAPGAPLIARTMAQAANTAGVGPMAAVAGAFAELVGKFLLKLSSDVIVENGGDIFIGSTKTRRAAIFAGASPFSNLLAVEFPPERTPLGICTSSGTVGPSLSFGKADAAVIMANSAALADAVASAAGNVVHSPGDVKKGIKIAKGFKDVLGAVIIKDDQLAAWGGFDLVPIDR